MHAPASNSPHFTLLSDHLGHVQLEAGIKALRIRFMSSKALVGKESAVVNHKRVERLYAEARLQVRRRKRKKIPIADRQLRISVNVTERFANT